MHLGGWPSLVAVPRVSAAPLSLRHAEKDTRLYSSRRAFQLTSTSRIHPLDQRENASQCEDATRTRIMVMHLVHGHAFHGFLGISRELADAAIRAGHLAVNCIYLV